MPNYSAIWVSLHKGFSYAKKNLSALGREIYIVAQANFYLLKKMKLGQNLRTWILCKLLCENYETPFLASPHSGSCRFAISFWFSGVGCH
jgi:hypothetical protein